MQLIKDCPNIAVSIWSEVTAHMGNCFAMTVCSAKKLYKGCVFTLIDIDKLICTILLQLLCAFVSLKLGGLAMALIKDHQAAGEPTRTVSSQLALGDLVQAMHLAVQLRYEGLAHSWHRQDIPEHCWQADCAVSHTLVPAAAPAGYGLPLAFVSEAKPLHP